MFKECIKSFSYLIDAKIYEENGCIEEFSENIFNYLSKTFHISPLEDKVNIIFNILKLKS